ncbi:acetyl-CoA carboxylase biotin carboxylase subunit family protein [Kitasatospora sp. NPDC101157]|uniref:ATP-grasp domain-containing protein n=1 Tax=Kitasatospora sp. NPDC101157 TaxID=3364098 RepID=UPI00381291EE
MHEATGAPVLLIGWYAKAVEAFETLGRRVVCAVTPTDLAAAQQVDSGAEFVVVPDTSSVEDVLAGLARAELAPEDFAAICSMREFSLVTASALSGLAGRPGLGLRTALALRDKYLQKRMVRAAGIPVADCRTVSSLGELAQQDWRGPVVVKPLAGGAARDTCVIGSPEALRSAVDAGQGAAEKGPWLVEDFVEGPEIHVDGIVSGGEVTFLSVSRYLQNVIAIKSGGVVGSVVVDPADGLYARAGELTRAALAALGHRDGIFHLEAFVQDHGLVFSECAGRIGGGLIRDVVAHQFGVSLVEAWARAALGEPYRPSGTVRGGTTGFVHLPAPPGRVAHLPTTADILDRPGCVTARVDAREGREMPDVTVGSNVKAGRVMVVGEDEEQVEARIGELVAWFRSAVAVQGTGAER